MERAFNGEVFQRALRALSTRSQSGANGQLSNLPVGSQAAQRSTTTKMLNMKSILLVTILLPLFSSAQLPGGIPDPSLWLIPQYNTQGNIELWEKTQNQLIHQYNSEEEFNFNPALKFEGGNEMLPLKLGVNDISRMQIFVVYEPQDSVVEKAVWAVHDGERDALLCTTHRLADFKEKKFMNNLGRKKHQPQLNTYQRYVQKSEKAEYQLVIGKKGIDQTIPVQNFRGKMAEVIMYDRVLNSKEKAKVETYLALKYGIGIDKSMGQSLYSSKDLKLWDVQKLFDYSNFIAGIGRDDGSGLEQKQSGAVYYENIFSLALGIFQENNVEHEGELMDQQFLIWGESDGNLQLEEKRPGQVQQLNKQWLLRNHGFSTELTQLKFETDKLPFEIEEDEIFWLVIDRSGRGEYPMGKTEYIAMNEERGKSAAYFSNIDWDGGEKQIFSLAKGPKMIPTVWIDQPNCREGKLGKLNVGAQGGKAPYFFNVKNEKEELIASWSSNTIEPQTIDDINSGNYQLEITDDQGWQYEEYFFINPSDAVFSNLQNNYELASNEVLRLDASLGLDNTDLDYEWTLPNGESHFSPIIDIRIAGDYLLNINSDGCRSQQKINIEKQLLDNFKNINLFPNPSLGGYFEVTAELFQASPLEIKIFSASGSALHQTILPTNHRHRYQDHLLAPGFYLLQLTSNNSTSTQKLIVHAEP